MPRSHGSHTGTVSSLNPSTVVTLPLSFGSYRYPTNLDSAPRPATRVSRPDQLAPEQSAHPYRRFGPIVTSGVLHSSTSRSFSVCPGTPLFTSVLILAGTVGPETYCSGRTQRPGPRPGSHERRFRTTRLVSNLFPSLHNLPSGSTETGSRSGGVFFVGGSKSLSSRTSEPETTGGWSGARP